MMRYITLLRMGSLSITTETVSRPILFIVTTSPSADYKGCPPCSLLTFLCHKDFPSSLPPSALSHQRYLDAFIDPEAPGQAGVCQVSWSPAGGSESQVSRFVPRGGSSTTPAVRLGQRREGTLTRGLDELTHSTAKMPLVFKSGIAQFSVRSSKVKFNLNPGQMATGR